MPYYRYAQQQAQRQTQLIAMFRRRPLSFELSTRYLYHLYVTLIPGTQTSPQVALCRYHPQYTRAKGPPCCWSYSPPTSNRLPANPPPEPSLPRDMSSIKQVKFPPQQPSTLRLSSPPLAQNFIPRASSSTRLLPLRSHPPPFQSRNFSRTPTAMVSSVNRTSLHPSGVT